MRVASTYASLVMRRSLQEDSPVSQEFLPEMEQK